MDFFCDLWLETFGRFCTDREETMSTFKNDKNGFTCECGIRNSYPSYAHDHWDVKLLYNCSCERQYILYRGKVTIIARPYDEIIDSEAFGD